MSKAQKSVSVRFPRPFKEKPDLILQAKYGALLHKIGPEHCDRHRFRVNVNSIPFAEQDFKLEWEAIGEVEPVAFGVFRAITAVGALVGFYAVLVELHWLPNIIPGSR